MSSRCADAARHRLEEPDVGDRRGQLDVAHPLAAHLGLRHFDAAPVADTPRYFMRLYLPQVHSQSFTGPKILRRTGRRAPA